MFIICSSEERQQKHVSRQLEDAEQEVATEEGRGGGGEGGRGEGERGEGGRGGEGGGGGGAEEIKQKAATSERRE